MPAITRYGCPSHREKGFRSTPSHGLPHRVSPQSRGLPPFEGEKVRVLPDCCHSFHLDCIDAWLLTNASCPSCRHSLLCAFSKKPSVVSQAEESSRMDVTERNESVAANGVQSFQISGDDLTMRASSSLASVKSASDLESGNVGETRKA